MLAIPLAELVALMVHSRSGSLIFGLRWTYLDLLLPLPTAFFVLMFLLETGEPCRLQFQKGALIVNLAALGFAFFVSPWALVVGICVLSSFCLWVSPKYYLKNPNRYAILPCVLLAFSVALYTSLPNTLFKTLETLVSRITGGVIASLFGNQIESSMAGTDHLRLTLGSFVARVGRPCLGFDGFFYFTVLFLLLSALYRKGLLLGRWFCGYFLGLALIFSLNILRVLLLVSIGAWANSSLGPEAGGNLLSSLVHPHLGWLLYTPGLLLYLPWCLRQAKARDRFDSPFESFWAEIKSILSADYRKG